ncbi:MAG TPA: MoxR family ATPase [Gammaproteobacteria bacterium]|nr:MoxR family ATPase [Gammaproteobacteria bacterium]
MTQQARELEAFLQRQVGAVVYGVEDVIHALTIALIGGGHVLLEGPPGLGKTLLSNTFARALGGEFRRIQGTADLMPSDLTGVHVFDAQRGEFVFRPGPLFADVVLVDEVNRAGPKTQSALLEAMEERYVTVDGKRFALPADFLIVATQNPREFEGTYPLPESQLDRFMLSVRMGYPSRENEARVIAEYGLPPLGPVPAEAVETVPSGALAGAREELRSVHLSEALVGYVLDIVAASRQSTSVGLALSSRAAVALARCARIEAALRGGDFVVPDDVKRVAPWVIPHRIVLTPDAALEGSTASAEVERFLNAVRVPRETA